jgi:transposase
VSVSSHATISTQQSSIFVSLELSRSTWLVISLAPGNAARVSRRTVPGGDIFGLFARISQFHKKVWEAHRCRLQFDRHSGGGARWIRDSSLS